ncbi:MAG: SDR family oxidoreductase [Anaerolineales bacterium]|nr:SDR family oxidoreductase [Anaerolineales bacterium]
MENKVLKRNYDEIQVGDKATLVKTFTADDVERFASLSGDHNPLHVDAGYAKTTPFKRQVVHGMLSAAYISTLIGTQLPGEGALWFKQNFEFTTPIFLGETAEFSVTVTQKIPADRVLVVQVSGVKETGEVTLKGEGMIMVLEEKKMTDAMEKKSLMDKSLEGHLALVTGSSRGIGAAIALHLASAGAKIIINYRSNATSAQEMVEQIKALGSDAIAVGADMRDEDEIQQMVSSAKAHFGKTIDILVNNASLPVGQKAFEELCWEDINTHHEIIVGGAYRCIKATLPGMIESSWGRIVNVGSAATWGLPPTQWTGYVMAKAALGELTQSLAVEFGPKGITTNMVSPGITETEMMASMPPRMKKVQAMQNPLRRLAEPEDIARAVYFLCSPLGDYVNGADLPVSGGSVM